jgi:hypothetical protein
VATRVIEQVLDDLNMAEGADHYTFALNGQQYEIDLAPDNFKALEEVLAPYVAVARTSGKKKSRDSSRPSKNGPTPGNAEIRAWAQQHDISVGKQGRIPEKIRQAYLAGDPKLAAS